MNYETIFAQDGETIEIDPAIREQRRRRRIIIGVVIAAVALVLAYMAFRTMGSGAAAPADKTAAAGQERPRVTVVVPGRQAIDRTVTATGTLSARRDMPISVVGEGGMVTRVLVEPGAWVRQGQVLATIERSVQTQQAASLAAQLNVARADARIAQAELDRSVQLVDRGFISKADVDRRTATRDAADARVKVADAQLREAQARNGRLDIRAPTAGLILTRDVEPGQVVGAGTGTLFRMAMNGQLELRAQLAEGDLQRIPVGARASVTPVGTTQTFEGQVWQVSPIVNADTRQGIARVALNYDKLLRPGGFAAVTITNGSQEAPLLPESAVQSDEKGNFVYIIDKSDKVVRRTVTVGDVNDQGVAINDGLTGTERVVLSAGGFLNPGEIVTPVVQTASR